MQLKTRLMVAPEGGELAAKDRHETPFLLESSSS